MTLYEITRLLVARGCPVKVLTDRLGREMLVDADFVMPNEVRHWYAHNQRGRWYAIAVMVDGSKTPLHRVITGAVDGMVVDHANHHGLDNRRENLRVCTQAQNNCNRAKRGCWFDKSRGKWTAHIKAGGRRIVLGRFGTMEAARAAYSEAAKKHHGEFAGSIVESATRHLEPTNAKA